MLAGSAIFKYCFVGVFSVGPCKYDWTTLGVITEDPEA